jgi:hypothetical protein
MRGKRFVNADEIEHIACTRRMKSSDIAVIKFTSAKGQHLFGVVADVTEKGFAVLAPCWGVDDLVDDLPATRSILDWTRISIDRGLDPLKVYDPETIGLTFVQPKNVLAIFVEDQQAISDLVARWHEAK